MLATATVRMAEGSSLTSNPFNEGSTPAPVPRVSRAKSVGTDALLIAHLFESAGDPVSLP
jgi:hypothetical protein